MGSRSRSPSEEVMELSLSADISTLPSLEELQVLHNLHLHSADYDEGDSGLVPEHRASLQPVRIPSNGTVSNHGGCRRSKVSQLPQMLQTHHSQQPVEHFQHPQYNHLAQPVAQSQQQLPCQLSQQNYMPEVSQSNPPLQPNQLPRMYPPAECSHEEVLEDRQLFTATLQRLHEWLGLSEKIPRLGGRELDLHMLYYNVCSLGGCESVIARKLWRDAAESFHYPETITNVSFSLRRAYLTFLWDYEQVYMHERSEQRIVPPPSSHKDAAAAHGGAVEPTTPSVSSLVGRPAKKRKTADNLATSFVSLAPGAPTQLVAAARTPGQPEAFAVGLRGTVTLDARFDAGYFVTVKVGKQEFQGMLYYPPPQQTKEAAEPEKKAAPAPKPNRTPFNFFSMGTRLKAKEANPEMSQTDITRQVGKLWQGASEAEKAPFVAIANQDKHRYQAELDAYNHRLAAQAASEAAGQAAQAVTVAQQAMSHQQPPAAMQGGMHCALMSEGSNPMQ